MTFKTLCIAALAALAVAVAVSIVKFIGNEISTLEDGSFSEPRALRVPSFMPPTLTELSELGLLDKHVTTIKPTSACVPTPNATLINKEDLELSCIEFRRKHRPTIDEAFSHLGQEAVSTAKELQKQFQEQIKRRGAVRIAVGTGPSTPKYGNFVATDYPIVDILNATRLSALLEENSVEALFASHVWEHFTYPQALQALQNVQCLLRPHGVARLGVPDAAHPDSTYHEKKAKEGFPEGQFRAAYRDSYYAGHRALWTERKFATAASMAGLNARPLEWWASGDGSEFCYATYNDKDNGRINRSLKYDSRNTKDNPYAYTSLIVDLSPQVLE